MIPPEKDKSQLRRLRPRVTITVFTHISRGYYFGFIAICLPTLSAMLHMDVLSKFVHGLSSLFSLRQRSQDTEAPWVDLGQWTRKNVRATLGIS